MSSLISTYLIDQIVSVRYLVGTEISTAHGKLVDYDGTFIRILSGYFKTIRIIDHQHVLACGTPKTLFKLNNPAVAPSYEMINTQYIISVGAAGGIDRIIEYGQNVVVCDDRGNCEVVYNHGPVPIIMERGGE